MALTVPVLGTDRPLIVQQFLTRQINVTAAALPIDATLDKTKLITGWSISNPTTGASVFIGNAGVTITGGANPGFEIPAGTAPFFGIEQARQMYEIQQPLLGIKNGLECAREDMGGLPFSVWDLSNFFIVAAANTTVTLITFPAMWL